MAHLIQQQRQKRQQGMAMQQANQAQSGKGKTGTLGMLSTMMARGIQNKRRKGGIGDRAMMAQITPRTATTSALADTKARTGFRKIAQGRAMKQQER